MTRNDKLTFAPGDTDIVRSALVRFIKPEIRPLGDGVALALTGDQKQAERILHYIQTVQRANSD